MCKVKQIICPLAQKTYIFKAYCRRDMVRVGDIVLTIFANIQNIDYVVAVEIRKNSHRYENRQKKYSTYMSEIFVHHLKVQKYKKFLISKKKLELIGKTQKLNRQNKTPF